VVEIDGITSTRIDYIASGEQATLVLIGYNIETDTRLSDHFIVG
jgi:hypothetical protein